MEHGRGAVDPLIEIRTVAETGSTNADMLALAAAGAGEGLWLRAERQTAGRGRQGRRWVSAPGNMYASTLVKLREGDRQASELSPVAAVALWEAVDGAMTLTRNRYFPGPPFHHVACTADGSWPEPQPGSLFLANELMLKWPNDLLLCGEKVAGILLERAGSAVIIGFGVNCVAKPRQIDQAATCLVDHGAYCSARDLVNRLAQNFVGLLALWRSDGFSPIRRLWLDRAYPLQTPIEARLPEGVLTGTFDGMNSAGALILRLASGQRREIYAGDVFPINVAAGAH